MSKKQLTAAQGIEAACILFAINTDVEGMVRLAHSAQLPSSYLDGPGAISFCSEWRAFTHAVVTSGLMQYAPNSVLMGYLRQTGNLLRHADQSQAAQHGQGADKAEDSGKCTEDAGAKLEAFVDGPFAQYMPLLAQGQQSQCPELFCQRLAVETARIRGEATPLDNQSMARLAAIMAMLISAVWDKLEQYEILAD